MAQKIDQPGPTRAEADPWLNGFSYDHAFDGTTWEITQDEDFTVAVATMGQRLRQEFRRRYGYLDLHQVDEKTLRLRHVRAHPVRKPTVQSRPMSDF